MRTLESKALELEMSALKHLDAFIHEHALWFLMGAIYVLLALLVWVLSGGLRRKSLRGRRLPHVPPIIVIHVTFRRPPPPEPFDPFPPHREPPFRDDHYLN